MVAPLPTRNSRCEKYSGAPALDLFVSMRRALLASAAALALTLAAAGGAAHAYSGPRAAVLFLPSPPRAAKGIPMLERLSRLEGLTAFGYMSSVQGAYEPEQVLLDMSAGARVGGSLYDSDLPGRSSLRQVGGGGAVTAGRDQAQGRVRAGRRRPGNARRRRCAPPAVGVATRRAGRPNREAWSPPTVRDGSAWSWRPPTAWARALALWESHALLVARLPGRAPGRQAARSHPCGAQARRPRARRQQPNVYAGGCSPLAPRVSRVARHCARTPRGVTV